jgi:hypothetical protein
MRFRPAGGAFGPIASERYYGMGGQHPAALDAFGTGVVLLRVDHGTPRQRLDGYLRSGHETVFTRAAATPDGSDPIGVSMATDAFGNGVVAYVDGETKDVMAVDYSASAPKLSDVAALPGAGFRFRVNEPARVRATLWRGGRRIATVRRRAGAGVSRMGAPRGKLRRGTRYVARLRAFDAGRRGSRTVKIAFRAR